MKSILTLITFTFILCSCSQFSEPQKTDANEENNKIIIGEKLSLYSEVLDEDRPYWVHLPESYSDKTYTSRSYPVLYILDGAEHFNSASGVVQFMGAGINSNRQIPELIIVAIPNIDRTKDQTTSATTNGFDGSTPENPRGGNGDNFLKFIEKELITKIENDYRTLPHRTFVGHSFGGLILLHSFVENPHLFNAYIAIDPSIWWDDAELLARGRIKIPELQNLKSRIFISMADHPSGSGHLAPIKSFIELLERIESPDFQIDSFLFEGEDHVSVPLTSLYRGLLHVFEGFKPNLRDARGEPRTLLTHFDIVSEMFGFKYPPPEKMIDDLVYDIALRGQPKENGLKFYQLNTELYPNSSHAFEKLASLYNELGNKNLARKNYQKAIELDGENEVALKALEEL